ncbi:plant invertase/pectin methylesterase inhibitor superfamily protein [Actinidia rufa]|uniref:Plant invertase/pectin methylesterase inhibitor superfamily protein n=1 Tax=Actinidia rufa TaxID=165716 RepID=A0A7J0F076_9ERIC|nr:plant invertase/pectin methylesterase inhibitor superfamily protein [Actinidia rufa]
MPSPSLVLPSSYPSISEPRHSRSHSSVPPSNISLCSVNSEKPTQPKKVGIFRPKKSTKNSELTEESLEKFNIRNESLDEHRKSAFTYSPYYRGLTDSTLFLNRQKFTASSPGRESNVTSISTSSRSSFGVKMKELGSCFTTSGKEEKVVEVKRKSKGSQHARTSSSSSLSALTTRTRVEITTLAQELGLEGEIVSVGFNENDEYFSIKGKPLRERDSEPRTQPPSSLPPVSPPQSPPGLPPPTYPSSQSLLSLVSPPPTPQTYLSSPQSSEPSVSTQPHTHPSPPPVSPPARVLNMPSTQSLVPSVSAQLQVYPSPPPKPLLLSQVSPLHPSTPPSMLTSISHPSQKHLSTSQQSSLSIVSSPPPPPQAHLSPPSPPLVSSPSSLPASPLPATQQSPPQLLLSPSSSPPIQAQASPPHLAQTSPQLERPPPSPPPPAQTSPQTLLPPLLPPPQAQTSPANRTTKNENVYGWADKYRPESLKDFICNRNKALELQTLPKADDGCGQFIFEGPPGVGKRTMIRALLREAYGPERVMARVESKSFHLKGEAVGSIKVTVKTSLQHVEVNLSEVKGYEKHVIVELIQETINRLGKKTLHCNKDNCQVIILNKADKLSADVLVYIKWQLERHRGCSKVFFCCIDASKLQPIIPLCTIVKLLPPSNEEIAEVLEFIAKQEEIELPHQLAKKIANNSKNNLRQAIRSFEATWKASSPLKEDQEILNGWEDDIANIAKNIVEEQSPKHTPNKQTLVGELKNNVDKEYHEDVDSLYEDYYKNLARNRHGEMVRRHNDPVKKNLHQFTTIEGNNQSY